jgi:hypothetical protein
MVFWRNDYATYVVINSREATLEYTISSFEYTQGWSKDMHLLV